MRNNIYILISLVGLIITKVLATKRAHPWDTITNINYTICPNFRCFERARYVQNSIDVSTNPCTDFYQYTCGKWIKNYPVPTTETEYSIETYLKYITARRVQDLLKQDEHPREKDDVKAAKRLYRECMKRHELERLSAGAMKSQINQFGFWPICSESGHHSIIVKHWVKVLKHYTAISGDSALFNIKIGISEKKKPIIQIEEIDNPFVMLDVVRWDKKKEELYIKFLKKVIESLNIFTVSACKPEERIREVIQFRQKLDENVMASNRHSTYQTMTIKQFQGWYDSKISTLRSKAHMPWLEILQAAFPTINGVNTNENTEISVKNKAYFELLAHLLHQTPMRVIVNHIQLYFVEGHLKMSPKLIKSLKEVILNDDTFLDDLTLDIDKLHLCILDHPMQETIANMYNEVVLTKSVKNDVFALANDIKDMLKLQMTESNWLHAEKKVRIGQKLNGTNIFIGVKNVKSNHPQLHDKSYSTTLQMVPYIMPDATFMLQQEHVLIGTGYLQSPIYEEDMPFVVTYGSLGPLLGHEFFHSFQSALSRKYNRLVKKYDNLTLNEYGRKTRCFVDHYNKFEIKELKDLPVKHFVKPDLVRTVDENIADTMGLKAAYEAYRRKLWQNNGVCPIPLFNFKLSCDQIFFISFALTFCGNIPSMEIRKVLKRLAHLPPRMRVNGAVSNMEAFTDAFHCSKKSSLNIRPKCDIWS